MRGRAVNSLPRHQRAGVKERAVKMVTGMSDSSDFGLTRVRARRPRGPDQTGLNHLVHFPGGFASTNLEHAAVRFSITQDFTR